MTDVVTALKGFLAKHSGELEALTGVLQTILPALPIGTQDRAKVDSVLTGLQTASQNIANAVNNIDGGAPSQAVVKRSDLDASVRDVLPGMLPGILGPLVTAAVADATKGQGAGS